jgi:inosine-uridine nucleoside N-ribohydrolase
MRTKKVILDVDPGISDAVALAIALFDPSVEVVAVTAVGGNVGPDQATRNVQALIDQLDPPRRPRIGVASSPDDGLPANCAHLFGADGLGNAHYQVSELQHRHPSEKVISDEVRAAPDEITIVALGPLTNVARAFARDPGLPALVNEVIIMGGTAGGPGNVTPAAEFNIFCDPVSARHVFRSASTKILVPLEVTSRVMFTYDLLNQLPAESTRAGRMLRQLLPYSYRTHRQEFGLEHILLHDAVVLMAALHPELFELERTAGDVELAGELTTGATVFDRRPHRQWRPNMHLATTCDTIAVTEQIMQGLAAAGTASLDHVG